MMRAGSITYKILLISFVAPTLIILFYISQFKQIHSQLPLEQQLSLYQVRSGLVAVGLGCTALYVGYKVYKNQVRISVIQSDINRLHQKMDDLYKEQDSKIKDIYKDRRLNRDTAISRVNNLRIGDNRSIMSTRALLENKYRELSSTYNEF